MCRRHHAIKVTWIALLALVAACAGCKSSSSRRHASTQASVVPALMRHYAMASADGYCNEVYQGLDDLAESTKRPDVALWAKSTVVTTGYATITNATGPNDAGAMLDMLVYSSLKRMALEDYWIPTLLKEEGAPLVDRYRRAEEDVWANGAKVLTAEQLSSLRGVIAVWRREHPDQHRVIDARLQDFQVIRATKSGSGVKLPSNLLGMLYIDPLAGLDPVAAELKAYRDLTERMMFAAIRMPRVLGRQADFQFRYALLDPQVQSVVTSTTQFSDATSRFSDAVAKYPNQFKTDTQAAIAQALKGISTERQAALDQANTAVTSQRDAIVKELDAQQSKLKQVITDVTGVLDRADQTGKSLNAATAQTVTTTEQATQRTLNLAFRLALTLLLVLLLGIPLVFFLYRVAGRRWLGGASSPDPSPTRAG